MVSDNSKPQWLKTISKSHTAIERLLGDNWSVELWREGQVSIVFGVGKCVPDDVIREKPKE